MTTRLAIALLLCSSLAGRDWKQYPAIAESDAPGDIYVVGDVHSDYDRVVKALQAAQVIAVTPGHSRMVAWRAGASTLVFAGDLIDKGNDALGVLALVRTLGRLAAQKGGRVFAVMGNHEAEFLAEPHARKSKEFVHELKAQRMAADDVARCAGEVGAMLCGMPFGVRVRDWFISHAGNTGGRSLQVLDRDLREGVDKQGYRTEQLLAPDSLLEARLSKPWFDRRLLEVYTAALGVHHIVQGHQHGEVVFGDGVIREKGQMFQRWGLIFLVDTGMSRGVGDSAGAVLRIRGETAVAICPDGRETTIWDAKNAQDAGGAPVCRK